MTECWWHDEFWAWIRLSWRLSHTHAVQLACFKIELLHLLAATSSTHFILQAQFNIVYLSIKGVDGESRRNDQSHSSNARDLVRWKVYQFLIYRRNATAINLLNQKIASYRSSLMYSQCVPSIWWLTDCQLHWVGSVGSRVAPAGATIIGTVPNDPATPPGVGSMVTAGGNRLRSMSLTPLKPPPVPPPAEDAGRTGGCVCGAEASGCCVNDFIWCNHVHNVLNCESSGTSRAFSIQSSCDNDTTYSIYEPLYFRHDYSTLIAVHKPWGCSPWEHDAAS